ncbi:MAG TPA: hypothetical protein VG889_03205 [Rhizomicrobium sp.]|nr:hypothetical protein [Rhizomicrobium sp.]
MTEKKAPEPTPANPLSAHALSLPEGIHQPNLTEDLLNAQLAEVLALIRDAAYLYRNSPDPSHVRGEYIGHAESLVSVSTKVADQIARLRGATPADKRIHYVVERVEGGGSAKTEKRMANGKGNGHSHP